jgi:hypothetical protein
MPIKIEQLNVSFATNQFTKIALFPFGNVTFDLVEYST